MVKYNERSLHLRVVDEMNKLCHHHLLDPWAITRAATHVAANNINALAPV